MAVIARSFAKINLGLSIGPLRPDGFHNLRTVYQTIALHDVIRVEIRRGIGIEIRCHDPQVPCDSSNTCYRVAEKAMVALKARGRVIIEIEKRLPVQGGLGGASANAAATLLALERTLRKTLPGAEKLRIAAEVGSDLPLFLVGGTVLGLGRGEEVYPLPDLPAMPCVIATPEIGVSTAKAFADWDLRCGAGVPARESAGRDWAGESPASTQSKTPQALELTPSAASDRIIERGRAIAAWLSGQFQIKDKSGKALSGVPAGRGGRAGNPLLDLVRAGIENDFEQVVFPQYPELGEVKRVLVRAGALYASLSGSGSAIYGLFASRAAAEKAASRVRRSGIPAAVTTTLTRRQYWKRILD
jgi:4-diphosphocytidyl-2-C-methyl-D-erythritol kinase